MGYLKPKSKGVNKLESRWGTGIWLGVREESGEILIGTKEGVIEFRSFRRKGSHADRWDWAELEAMQGVPWEPVPGREGIEVKANVAIPFERSPQN